VRYIDSGDRTPGSAVAHWLQTELTTRVNELRWQSGFFSVDGLHPFLSTLQRMRSANLPVYGLIGSNEGETLEGHVTQLVSFLGIPRSGARLGIISFGGAYFHPKTYHLRRTDGSQAAYVGSANLTLPGLSGQHVEAGIILDTAAGDPPAVLNAVANSVDTWFANNPAGLEIISRAADVARLTSSGILSLVPPPRPSSPSSSGTPGRTPRPRLQPLIAFPRMPRSPPLTPTTAPAVSTGVSSATIVPPAPTRIAAVPLSPYPSYLLFRPGATGPTAAAGALTGSSLPSGNSGLIIRLNRDSARHWSGGKGTSNISIPVATLSTFRFGIYAGARPRPRCEFPIVMRFLYSGGQLKASTTDTNIMAYGFSPGDPGHGDVRLVVPRPPAIELLNAIQRAGSTPPANGDVAFLEWPTPSDPTFGLSLIDRTSALHRRASTLLSTSPAVGGGACWREFRRTSKDSEEIAFVTW
jgi:hypothetical protein